MGRSKKRSKSKSQSAITAPPGLKYPPFISLVVGGGMTLIGFIPIFVGGDFYTDKHSNISIEDRLISSEFKVLCGMLLVTTIPVMIDIIRHFSYEQLDISNYHWNTRTILCISSFIASFIMLSGQHDTTQGVNTSLLCSVIFALSTALLRIIFTSTMLYCLSTMKNTIFDPNICVYLSFLASISWLLQLYSNNLNDVVDTLSEVIFGFRAFALLGPPMYGYWLYTLYKETTTTTWTTLEYHIIMYLSLGIVLVSGDIFNYFLSYIIYGDGEKWNANSLIISMVTYVICMLILAICPSYITQLEIVRSKDKILATKDAYVRFISRELRTPLDTIFFGLKSYIDEHALWASAKDPKIINEYQSLCDILSASGIALEILNEFLGYESMAKGQLYIEKQETNILDYIYNIVNIFSIAVYEKKLKLGLHNGSKVYFGQNMYSDDINQNIVIDNKTLLGKPYIYPNDTVYIDRNKIGQVLRNLLSNAVKYTSEGGSIEVHTRFAPTTHLQPKSRSREEFLKTARRRISMSISKTFGEKKDKIVNEYAQLPDNTSGKSDKSDKSTTSTLHGNTSNKTKNSDQYIIPIQPDTISPETSPKPTTKNEEDITELDGYLIIEIIDTGKGMTLKQQEALFKDVITNQNTKVMTTWSSTVVSSTTATTTAAGRGGNNTSSSSGSGSSDIDGSGLGLWISKGIMDLHQGKIFAFSEGVDKGSIFTIHIPMLRKLEKIMRPAPPVVNELEDDLSAVSSASTLRRTSMSYPTQDMLNMLGPSPTLNSDYIREALSPVVRRSSVARRNSLMMMMTHQSHIPPLSNKSNISEFTVDSTERDHHNSESLTNSTNLNTEKRLSLDGNSTLQRVFGSEIDSEKVTLNMLKSTPISPISHDTNKKNRKKVYLDNTEIESHGTPFTNQTSVSSADTQAQAVTAALLDNTPNGATSPNSRIYNIESNGQHNTNKTTTTTATTSNTTISSPVTNTTTVLKSPESHIAFNPLHGQMKSALNTHTGSKSSTSNTSKVKKNPHILVVDDSKTNRRMLLRLLGMEGYTCQEAGDGVEAIQKVRETGIDGSVYSADTNPNQRYDVIIMDFIMPNMDGPTATTEIRKLGFSGPIIGVTGNAIQSDKLKFINAGASRVLVKPLDMNMLRQVLIGTIH